MADRNLNDDLVKLVEYTIVTIEREHERIIERGERVVTENMDGEAFASWMISEIGRPGEAALVTHPAKKWEPRADGARDPRQYLRVYYNVLERWAKQDLHYEERQLEVLERIAVGTNKK